jgi:carbon storage regulator
MLVLSRKRSEEIMVGDDISIMVVEIRGDKVRIGIHAPKHIKVHRKEIWLTIQKGIENEQCVNAEVPGTGCVRECASGGILCVGCGEQLEAQLAE